MNALTAVILAALTVCAGWWACRRDGKRMTSAVNALESTYGISVSIDHYMAALDYPVTGHAAPAVMADGNVRQVLLRGHTPAPFLSDGSVWIPARALSDVPAGVR